MSKKRVAIGAVALAVLLSFSFLATGEEVSGKLSGVIRTRLGLNSDLYRVIETEYQGERVILIAIYGDDRVLNSSLGDDIKSGLRENMGESPVAVSVLARDKGVKFHPYALRVLQGDEKRRPKKLIGITDGFKDGAMPERVPIEGEVFWGSKGIITLGSEFDESSPFSVKYGTTSAEFSVSRDTARETVEAKEPEAGDEGSGLKATEPEATEPETGSDTSMSGEGKESKRETGSAPGNSRSGRSGQGFILLAQLATLLSVTLSFL